ncbi:hypothetical protein LXL04_016325 [Taraxacum kok-saghyz]
MLCSIQRMVCNPLTVNQYNKSLIGGAMSNSDGISQLPDCILHHILSFIPTKDVVKTSILSKRWKNLWTSVSNLDFDDALLYKEMDGQDPPNETSFMNFVDRVLLFCDTLNINKFRLSCRVCFNPSRIHTWISSAILHNVHELDLCLFTEDPFTLPQSIFSSISLTTLKIEMNCDLQIPSSITLPNLKTLHLSLITFPDDDLTQKLFAGCLALEDLVLLDCEWTNLKNVMISSSNLKRLTIDDLPYFGPPDDPGGCKITIDTPNLALLKYTGYLSNEIWLCGVSELMKADIRVQVLHERQKEVTCHVVDLLKGLKDVNCLRISKHTIESLVFVGNLVVNLPVFQNLTHLELSMAIENSTIEALTKFLTFCPNLQSLNFTEGFQHDICLVENDLTWSTLRLKTLILKNFRGNVAEICFVKCVLQHGNVSEKLNICWSENLLGDIKWQEDVKMMLKMIVGVSKSCVIITWG